MASEELAGSPRINGSKEGQTATRTFRVDDGEQDAFVESMMGIAYGAGSASVRSIATFPGKDWLVAESFSLEPMDGENPRNTGADGSNSYPQAGWKIQVNYKTLDYETEDSEAYISQKIDVGAEMVSLPSSGLRWQTSVGGSTTVSEEVSSGILIPTIEHQLTWHRVSVVPWAAIRAAIGRVNSAVFYDAAVETLLFGGLSAGRSISTDGEFVWTVDYKFSERITPSQESGEAIGGWNHLFRNTTSSSGFYRIETTAGDPIYQLASFSGLFPS